MTKAPGIFPLHQYLHQRSKSSSSKDDHRVNLCHKMATKSTNTRHPPGESKAKGVATFKYDAATADTLMCSLSSRRLIQPLEQSFTKGYYFNLYNSFKTQSSKLVQISTLFCGNMFSLSRVLTLIALFLVISLNLPSSTEAVLYEQSRCETHGWNAFPVWKYRAKPRWVAPMRTNRRMQKEFLDLFRGGSRKDKDSSSSEEDSHEDNFPLDIEELRRIADMCPKEAFFYSLSPKHIEASTSLARMFVAQHSPPEVLRLAKALLRSPYVNPKVWYYGIIGAAQERPDMTGFKLAHPVDAMPDLFVPGPMLFDLMKKYRSALKGRSSANNNATFTTFVHREKRSSDDKLLKRIKNLSLTSTTVEKKPANKGNKTIVQAPVYTHIIGQSSVAKGAKVDNHTISIINIPTKLKQQHHKKKEEIKRARSLSFSAKTTKKGKKNKKLGKKPDALKGNVTEYQADSSMWKRAKIDAFDDCLVVDGSVGVRNGIENKLWYFREDMMVNQHHWYWHQEYPLNNTLHRPRQGELFFYMHRNLIARYNAERRSNDLPLVDTFDIRPGALIKSAYDSQLADVNSGKFWTPRPHGVHVTDIIHEEDPDYERNLLVGNYNKIYGRLVRSIQVGHLLVGPIKTMKIRHTKGIEPLGNTLEASDRSVNPMFYDTMGFHNLGHQLIGLSTDPKFKARLPIGVMADTLTTMRDPAFYSYHTVVDNLFDMYKKSLPPYNPRGGEYPLRWDGVEILNVEVISKNSGKTPNQLRTFWANRRFELGPGVDHSIHNGDLEVDVCAVHLNHEPFDYKITVTLDPCALTKSNKGSVRIFLAPRYDQDGNIYPLKVQRRLMIHMDTFPVDLRVGKNVIFRRSYDSNAVTPWSKTIKQYENAPKHPQSADNCGCGWPTHMYIPKGSPKGTHFDLFVMLTNYDEDYVEENPEDLSIPEACNAAYMYCGVKWRQYPDAKPMGYPFDRLPFSVPIKCPHIGAGPLWSLLLCKFMQFFWFRQASSLEEYVSYVPNMASTIVEIRHLDKLVW